MTAVYAVVVTCDGCGVEETVTKRETGSRPTLSAAQLYLFMQGWVRKKGRDYCFRPDCLEEAGRV